MTPLLGTKNTSAPAGNKSGGDGRAARSLLSCALCRAMGRLWRGMGGMGRPEPLSAHHPRQQQGLSGFHEPRDTKHGFYGRPNRLARRRAAASLFTIVHHCSRLFGIVQQKILPLSQCPLSVLTGNTPVWFSRITRHETRITAFVVARHGAAMARHGRPPSPAPATRPFLFAGRQIFLLERTSLHFSPRGEAKCVRGPSGRGARRLARAGVLEQYVEHGKQAQRSPGGRIACFDSRVVRNAG